jgi:hypothetical protein
MKWFFWYYVASSETVLVPLLTGLRYRRFLGPDLKIFLLYLLVTILFVNVAIYFAATGRQNLWLENCDLPVEVGFIMWILSLWQPGSWLRDIMRYSILVFIFVLIAELALEHDFKDYTQFARPLEGVLFVLGGAWTAYSFHLDAEKLVTTRPAFWICAGLVLSYLPKLATYAASQILIEHARNILMASTLATTVFTILSNFLFTTAFRCQIRLPKSSGPSR